MAVRRRRPDTFAARLWYGHSVWRFPLLPLSWLYCAVTALRRFLYRRGVLKRFRPAVPVVVIGNVTVGGTGKTPVALWLAAALAERGHAPAILTRGYGAEPGPEPIVVSADSDVRRVGDEASMLAQRGVCPVVVHRDRAAAAQVATEAGATVLLTDDGLQHYRLDRDVEIAVVDGERLLGNGHLLPAGPLREPAWRFRTVDVVMVQVPDIDPGVPSPVAGKSDTVRFSLRPRAAFGLARQAGRPLTDFRGETVHAVAGIGNPGCFFRMLEASGIGVIPHPLPDHADLHADDLDFGDDLRVIMTEKDAVKCTGLGKSNWWYVPVDVNIPRDDADRILACVESRLAETVRSVR